MENGIIVSWKNAGEVLAEHMARVRAEYTITESIPMTYAGRLDPAAEGEMLYLVGDERFKKDEYLRKEKTYAFSILCGIKTDTTDLLSHVLVRDSKIQKEKIDALVAGIEKTLQGTHNLPLPSYSGYKVQGKALWTYAKDGKDAPKITKRMVVNSCTVNFTEEISFDAVLKKVENLFEITKGDFRKEECLKSWQTLHSEMKDVSLHLITCTVQVSAGTYIRSLIEYLAIKFQMPLCAFQITRTKIEI